VQHDQAPFNPAPAPVHLVAANVSKSQPLPANGSIQLAFDRLLSPASITRQTFILDMNALTPTVAYDPVSRVVTITPLAPLIPGQTYQIAIASPQSSRDVNGLRSIDGATLAPGSINRIDFLASPATTPPQGPPPINFCTDVFKPVFSTCNKTGCHGGTLPASGLLLGTPDGVAQTAVGRVARGSNTGPRSLPQPPSLLFGEDMPLIDPGTGGAGDPGNSWLLYKLLMAQPTGGAPSCDAGAAMMATDSGPSVDATVEASAGAEAGSESGVESGSDGSMEAANDAPADSPGEAGASDAGEDAGTDAAPAMPPPMPTGPANVSNVYSVCWQPITSSERATLASLIPGREMPYPTVWDASLATGVSIDALERVSLWIQQGATILPGGCP
jgi:hypothetical protein